MPNRQLSLAYDPRYRRRDRWLEALGEAQRVVSEVGLKEVAYQLDVQPSQVAHALQERERHSVKGEWLVHLAEIDTGVGLARAIVPARFDLVRVVEITPEERLARIEEALRRLPDGVSEAIYRDAGVRR